VKVYYDCDGVYEVSTFFSMIQPPLLWFLALNL
jgi:hypothetical protein